jgi:hypothetical protein
MSNPQTVLEFIKDTADTATFNNRTTDRKGSWLQTYTGIQFWPIDPRPGEIDIRDIAHSLANTCRYNGHCTRFYSVAEHCVLMAGFASPENQLAALLHDAAEAYIADVPRPLKVYLLGFQEIEHRIEECIAEKFGVRYPWHPEIKELDERILADEKEQLMAPEPADWCLRLPPLNVHIEGFDPDEAEALFLATYNRLRRR